MSKPIRLRPIVAACAAAALAACATASPAEKAGLRPKQAAASGTFPAEIAKADAAPTSLYGLFLAGEAALDRGSSGDAAFFLGRASEVDPDPYLKERAFTAAVIAGEITKAATVPLEPGKGSLAAERLARLVRAVEFLASNKGEEALATLKSESPQGQTAQAVILLTPWAAAAAGDWATATAAPTPAPQQVTPQLTNLFSRFGRARLMERSGRNDEAEVLLRGLTTASGDNAVFILGYGAFLERRGRRADAVALYEKAMVRSRDVEIALARDRAKAGRPAPSQPSLQEGAGEALLAPAATLVARRQPELGLALMRLALRLDPKLDDAWMLVGDAMAAAGDAEVAREAYAHIRPASSKYAAAQSRLAWSLQRAGQTDAALKLARDGLDRSKDNPQTLSLYADLLRENGRFGESIEVMDRLISRGPAAIESWRLYYLRGVALERSGRWDRAEPDLQQALKLNPNDPDVMNYLGFGWANRYQNLDMALELLQKAASLRPRSGEIRDSLGWARYRLGKYPDAVRDLERAVGLSPAEPDINDHLGDAYWQVGRKLEAEFQWRRVLTLKPDEKLRAEATTKIEQGLQTPAPIDLPAELPPGPVAAAATGTPSP
jgi:tetratricopeptide (TPR) repeat protein